jgi:hypothetical protein
MNVEKSRLNVPDGTRVFMSDRELVFGETIFTARSSNDLFDDTEALRERIQEDGYLVIRGFHDRELISRAQSEIVGQMVAEDLLEPGVPTEKLVARSGVVRAFRPRDGIVKGWPHFLETVEGRRTMAFYERFLGGPAVSLDHKWLRGVPPGRNIGAHYDVVFMGAGTKRLYTMWTALSDVSLEMGPLAFCPGSHRIRKLRDTYGAADAHQDLQGGVFSEDPYDVMRTLGLRWVSTPFEAGDVVIFGMYFMHAALQNKSDHFRLSCDTRYQLASEPVDRRHMGKDPDIIPKTALEKRRPVDELRKEWGLAPETVESE